VIDPLDLVNKYNTDLGEKSLLSDKIGAEFFRYFFLKNISPYDDGDFTYERAKELYNADLANGVGNLLSRVVKLCEKYLSATEQGLTPSPSPIERGEEHPEFESFMKNYDVMNAMNYIWKLVGEADNYMQSNQPFKVVKVDLEAGKIMLEILREKVYTIACLLNPFMPTTSEIIKKIIVENKMPEKPLFPRYE
jgi:methionyl-tRNA synthetase